MSQKLLLPWYGLIALVIVLAIGSYAISEHLFRHELEQEKKMINHEARLIESIAFNILQTKNYQIINDVLHDIGDKNKNIIQIKLVADNGFVLGYYKSNLTAEYPYSVTREVSYSYNQMAKLFFERDTFRVYEQYYELLAHLAIAVALILSTFFFVILRYWTRAEEARLLRVRTNELDEVNQSLQHQIEKRQEAETELYKEKELAEVTLKSIGDAVITTDISQRVTFLNPIAEKIIGWSSKEAMGKPLDEILTLIDERSRAPKKNVIRQCLEEGEIIQAGSDSALISRDGAEICIDDSAAPIRGSEGEIVGAVMVFQDVTEHRRLIRQMAWQAKHDALTGLINRFELERCLSETVRKINSENKQAVFMYLDLDQFKVINDTCGHVAGDELLIKIARILEKYVSEDDVLARLGGDEFGILLGDSAIDNATRIAKDLLKETSDFHFIWQEDVFKVGVSIGIVTIDKNTSSLSDVLSTADIACYAAKELGRNRIYVYQSDDADLTKRHGEMRLVSQINQALEKDQLVLYYQQISPLCADCEYDQYLEILVRMKSENGNLVPPNDFIPAAERYDLMPSIDRWVVKHSLEYLSTMNKQRGRNPLSKLIFINLSGLSMGSEQFLEFIKKQVVTSGVDPGQICFEVTETAAISNLSVAVHFMTELKRLGCRFALDDFGSGLSSFTYLKHLPVDYLKIDGSFVIDMLTSEVDLAMVGAINNIGHVLLKQTIAECVEDTEALEHLRTIGVDYAQGYGIQRPAPLIPD